MRDALLSAARSLRQVRWSLVAQWALAIALPVIAAAVLLPKAEPLEPTVTLASPVGRVAHANPQLGAPHEDVQCADADHCWQGFDHGLVTWTPAAGAFVIAEGPVLDAFNDNGGVAGNFGYATEPLREHNGGVSQHFTGGGIYTAGKETLLVTGDFWQTYAENQAEHGPLGYPITGEYDDSGVTTQRFAGGLVQRSETTVPIWGDIARAYLEEWGGVGGKLGLATSAPRSFPTAEGSGLAQSFAQGEAYASTQYGTHIVAGPMLNAYAERGYEASDLGPPRSSVINVTGGQVQDFAGGTAYLLADSDAMHTMLYGDIRNRYNELGGIDSSLGFPVTDRIALADKYYQRFVNGVILWVPDRGAMNIDPVAFEEWMTRPASLGNPVQDSWSDDVGVHTKFDQREVITADGNLYAADTVGPQTAVIICDSQCTPDNSWLDIGSRAAGFSSVVKRAYYGSGYGVTPPMLTTSVSDAVMGNEVMLPAGDPGVVILSLGGNDATAGLSDERIRTDAERLISRVKQLYPDTPLVVNGVLSKSDESHVRRRQVDAIVTDVARSQGVRTISLAGWGTKDKLEYEDTVHLTTKGHQQMGAVYGPALKKVLGR